MSVPSTLKCSSLSSSAFRAWPTTAAKKAPATSPPRTPSRFWVKVVGCQTGSSSRPSTTGAPGSARTAVATGAGAGRLSWVEFCCATRAAGTPSRVIKSLGGEVTG